MIPQRAVSAFIALATASTVKETLASQLELENPALLVTLPLSIVKHNLIPSNISEFSCPHRQKLHDKCSDVTQLDKMTVPPVNMVLEVMKVPLTKDAYKAIKRDLHYSRQMSKDDPLHKKISDYQQQASNQRLISSKFHETGEREGALMHSMLAFGFDLKAKVANIPLAIQTAMKRHE
ncbi:hypothetical protein [uncultured Legionella sp.]|uniref:hypothetical protein n=1 Tax=uncultured Legionella sp. TaxID=210934 RepID=UPI002608C9D8|nr:hypothetical protein [uncultured Legionella sp.]